MTATASSGERVANRNKAMAHSTRVAAHRILANEGPANPAEIARKIGESTEHVAYHVKYLADLGFAELVEERIASGNVKHVYRAVEPDMVGTDEWVGLSPEIKDQRVREFVQARVDDLVLGLRHGLGKDEEFHITGDHYSLDRDGLGQYMQILERARRELDEAAGNAAKRIAEDGAESKRYATMIGFLEIPAER